MASEMQILREVWLRANREGEVVLNFPTRTDAERVRFQLYKAAKHADPAIKTAKANCILRLEGNSIRVTNRSKDRPMLSIAQQLGLADGGVSDVCLHEEAEVSAASLLDKLAEMDKEQN